VDRLQPCDRRIFAVGEYDPVLVILESNHSAAKQNDIVSFNLDPTETGRLNIHGPTRIEVS
jgi:hypothetical protein